MKNIITITRKRAARDAVKALLKTSHYPASLSLCKAVYKSVIHSSTFHLWGGDFQYFSDVEDAAYEIGQFCTRWGRISVGQSKEKYGSARVYCHFGWYQLHCITHPGYAYSQYPHWLWKLDCTLGGRIVRPFWFIVNPWQKFIYRLAYKRAIKKYPHIRDEILAGADWPDRLEGL